jgi:hypothetical protein
MSQKKINPSESDLRKSAFDWINKTGNYGAEDVPEGWLTCQQICELKNITTGQAEGLIRRMINNGEWQKKEFRIKIGGAGIKKVMHYTGK